MQTSKTRNWSSDGPQRSYSSKPRSTRATKTSSDCESKTTNTSTRTSVSRSPKVVDRWSPRSPITEKKRPSTSRVTELESQLARLQDDLKKTRDQLNSSDISKRKAQQEAEEGRKQLLSMSDKLEESQRQLVEFSETEEARLQQLRKLSQDRDWAWQSELEAFQKQHSMDSTALSSAMTELQRLKMQFDVVVKSETAHARQSELAHSELQVLKQDMAETLFIVENLRAQLRECEKAESEAQSMVIETQQQLEVAQGVTETLRYDSLELTESLRSAVLQLEESTARIASLEDLVRKLQEDLHAATAESVAEHESKHDEDSQKTSDISLESEVEQLKSALEAAEVKHQEERIQSTMQLRSSQDLAERMKIESEQREAALESALKSAKVEIFNLKASFIDKEKVLQTILEENKELKAEKEKLLPDEAEMELEAQLQRSMAEVSELKAHLMDKETELQSISEENEQLKLEIANKEGENVKSQEAAIAELELAKAAEQDALLRLGYVTEEADRSSRRAARVAEQLDAAQAVNIEMETELRKLRVQSDQWRKAAEAAAAVLTTGNSGSFMERTASMDTDYSSIAGKLVSSPFSEDLSDDSPKKKNTNVLKKIGGLWKKGPK